MSKTTDVDAPTSSPATATKENLDLKKAPPKHPLPASRRTRIVVLAGPCGSGKTTVGIALASLLGSPPSLSAPFVDADDYHSSEAKLKMSSGTPLDDGDRGPWISRVAVAAREASVFSPSHVAVLACSSLKKKYRDALVAAANGIGMEGEGSTTAAPLVPAVDVDFVLLRARPSSLLSRLEERQKRFQRSSGAAEEVAGHFLPPALLQSQLESWEDSNDVFVIDNDDEIDGEKKDDFDDGDDQGVASATVTAIRTARKVLEAVGLDALVSKETKVGAAAAV